MYRCSAGLYLGSPSLAGAVKTKHCLRKAAVSDTVSPFLSLLVGARCPPAAFGTAFGFFSSPESSSSVRSMIPCFPGCLFAGGGASSSSSDSNQGKKALCSLCARNHALDSLSESMSLYSYQSKLHRQIVFSTKTAQLDENGLIRNLAQFLPRQRQGHGCAPATSRRRILRRRRLDHQAARPTRWRELRRCGLGWDDVHGTRFLLRHW